MMSPTHVRPALHYESKEETGRRGRDQVNAGGFTVRQGMIELLSRTTGMRNTVRRNRLSRSVLSRRPSLRISERAQLCR